LLQIKLIHTFHNYVFFIIQSNRIELITLKQYYLMFNKIILI
jgi:hypothetical protein